ncbi:hypothetical protein C3432_26760 [Citrobacter amalonaticus]|uniref:Uncharacterized protein n=1 Tax=Citrobacter amalonaticus TaxID=35703 RepID=A0A2S4RR04_CITAM|nr:hypothetical protein [Citrobacter amalonaticus]POT54609.1 hypothetical protein C3432_26760 [Citrobacter amalonaticus]POT69555.1 hypothetical protein C3436_26365 [Citrobacter amalonaticus]POU60366.1 hypothetical protein C3430_25285 [Citrobacter amalonaticus]POV02661.1 hypothetical protein C3424_25465 [Citrobacter amalonaticus]
MNDSGKKNGAYFLKISLLAVLALSVNLASASLTIKSIGGFHTGSEKVELKGLPPDTTFISAMR